MSKYEHKLALPSRDYRFELQQLVEQMLPLILGEFSEEEVDILCSVYEPEIFPQLRGHRIDILLDLSVESLSPNDLPLKLRRLSFPELWILELWLELVITEEITS